MSDVNVPRPRDRETLSALGIPQSSRLGTAGTSENGQDNR